MGQSHVTDIQFELPVFSVLFEKIEHWSQNIGEIGPVYLIFGQNVNSEAFPLISGIIP